VRMAAGGIKGGRFLWESSERAILGSWVVVSPFSGRRRVSIVPSPPKAPQNKKAPATNQTSDNAISPYPMLIVVNKYYYSFRKSS
jgi:hypothetical protein